jgi:hypothetical protein
VPRWFDPLANTPLEDRLDAPACPQGHGPMREMGSTHQQGNWLHEYWYCRVCQESGYTGRPLGDGLRLPPESAERTDDGDETEQSVAVFRMRRS